MTENPEVPIIATPPPVPEGHVRLTRCFTCDHQVAPGEFHNGDQCPHCDKPHLRTYDAKVEVLLTQYRMAQKLADRHGDVELNCPGCRNIVTVAALSECKKCNEHMCLNCGNEGVGVCYPCLDNMVAYAEEGAPASIPDATGHSDEPECESSTGRHCNSLADHDFCKACCFCGQPATEVQP